MMIHFYKKKPRVNVIHATDEYKMYSYINEVNDKSKS